MIINLSDLYTYTENVPLTAVGTLVLGYEVRRYRDVRNLGNQLAYQVLCTQRIIIPNKTAYKIGPNTQSGFVEYPAAVTNNIALSNSGGDSPTLVKYTPKTINAAINTTQNSDVESSISSSLQHTTGSSTSQSNSYEVSASLGFFGEALTGGASAEYSRSWGSEQSQSDTTGSDIGVSRQNSNSDSMTVKDWACYSSVDAANSNLTWTWGQEYPWDVIQFNYVGPSGNVVALPNFVQSRLLDKSQVLPPSQLSQFGIDFTMKSVWIINLSKPSFDSSVSFNHTINYCTASHPAVEQHPNDSLVHGSDSIAASLSNPAPFPHTTSLTLENLCIYGLDPIPSTDSNVGAIIGFIPNKFIIPPSPLSSSGAATKFLTISSSNNLMISDTTQYPTPAGGDAGAGFTASETALTATFTQNCTSLQITMNFKIIDTVNSYTLYIKHWKANPNGVKNPTGVMLSILFNDDINASTPLNQINKYVDALEAEGGENNLLVITLRNQDYGSVNYHDFLKLGLNTVQITITPIDGAFATCSYQIRAISVESS